MESATEKIRCRFVVADFLATDLSVTDSVATENPLLTISNGVSVAKMSNGFSVADLSASEKSVAVSRNQQRIFRC
jgi:hypothetical protein